MDATLIYDGSFEGFLCVVFEIYNRKISRPKILSDASRATGFFITVITVETNESHAARVWKRLNEKVSAQSISNFYVAFHSELPNIENSLFGYMQYVFANSNSVDSNFGNEHILRIQQVAKSVHRERHRMEAFVRFQLMEDGFYYAAIEPDFNVLPLISKHFTERYADQRWIIYDLKRHYGLYYDLKKTE